MSAINPFHPFGRSLNEDLAILEAGGQTGWWDDSGQPAPWPEDFLDPDAGWEPGDGPTSDTGPPLAPGEPPF